MAGKRGKKKKSRSTNDLAHIPIALLPATAFAAVPLTATVNIPCPSALQDTGLSTSTGVLNASIIGRILPLPDPDDEGPFSDPDSSLFDYQHMEEPGYSSVDFDKIRKRKSMSDRKREQTPPPLDDAYYVLDREEVELQHSRDLEDIYTKPIKSGGRKKGQKNIDEVSGSRDQILAPTYTQTEKEIRDAMRAVQDLSSEEEAEQNMITEVRIERQQTPSLPASLEAQRNVHTDFRTRTMSHSSSQQRDLEEHCHSLAVENEEFQTEIQLLRKDVKSLRKVAKAVNQGDTENATVLLVRKQLCEMKEENKALQSSVHRLSIELTAYQAKYKSLPPDSHGQQLAGLPAKGPVPSWLINMRYLSPLLVAYDKRMEEKNDVISTFQSNLEGVKNVLHEVVKENERLQKSYSEGPIDVTEWEQLKENARLILEENQNLLEQIRVKDNKAHDMHQAHISEVSKLTKQLVVIRCDKSDTDQQFTDWKQKYSKLRRTHDDLVLETKDNVSVQKYIESIAELKKKLIGQENASKNDMDTLYSKLQAFKMEHKSVTSQYVDAVAENKRLHAEIHSMHKSVRKAQNRMILLQKAIEQSENKELSVQEKLAAVIKIAEQVAYERDTYAKVAKDQERETKKAVNKLIVGNTTVGKMEEKLKLYKMKATATLSTAADRLKDQDETFNSQKQEYEREMKHLRLLLHDKETQLHEMETEKRDTEEDLEAVWQSASSENERMRESLRKSIKKLYKHAALQEVLDNEKKELAIISSEEDLP